MNDEQKFILEKLLGRIDFYLNVINVKAAFLITFNTFILGSILLKYCDIINQFTYIKIKSLVSIMILLITIGIICSLFKLLKAVSPFLESGNKPSSYQSLLYFGSVAELSYEDYNKQIENITKETVIYDLTQQTHLLSKSLTEKFRFLNQGIWWIIWFIMLPLVIVMLIKSLEWFFI